MCVGYKPNRVIPVFLFCFVCFCFVFCFVLFLFFIFFPMFSLLPMCVAGKLSSTSMMHFFFPKKGDHTGNTALMHVRF